MRAPRDHGVGEYEVGFNEHREELIVHFFKARALMELKWPKTARQITSGRQIEDNSDDEWPFEDDYVSPDCASDYDSED